MDIAKGTDLPDLLEHLGYRVKRLGSYYTTKKMDSIFLHFSLGVFLHFIIGADSVEGQIESAEQKRRAIAQNILTLDTVLKMLGAFDELFEVMDAADRRKLMEMFVAEVQLHPKDTWKMGKSPIKSIR